MTENTTFHEDRKFERLLREYDRQKAGGLSGLADRIAIFREAHKYLESERFDRFCERVHLRERIERDMMHDFARRLQKLEQILGSQLEAFAVLHLLGMSRSEFESVIELALIRSHDRCSRTTLMALYPRSTE
jgi:hypothetical protein